MTGIVLKRINENTKQVIERIKEKVVEINKALPEGVSVVDYYDQSELVDNSIHTVVEVADRRRGAGAGDSVAAARRFSRLAHHRRRNSLLHARRFHPDVVLGLSANLTSLGGLAISIGMMVDATVVMVENIYRHLEEHREHSMREAILVAAQEIGRPMFFAILIIIAVFLPVFTLQGSKASYSSRSPTPSRSR